MNYLTRRQSLQQLACGFGYLALAGLAAAPRASAAVASANPLAPRVPPLPAKAKRVIFIFMQGGPSQVDSYDYKPRLIKDDGQMMSFDDARTLAKTGKPANQRVMKNRWDFRQHGQSGHWVSELFPEIAKHADDLCVIKSMHTEGVAHGPATLFMHTGSTNLIRPSMGSWITYGLGSENENLPGFMTISPSMGNGGPRNFGNAFLPAVYQGTAVGRAGASVEETTIRNLTNAMRTPEQQLRQLEFLRGLNAEQVRRTPSDDAIEAVAQSYELAWRMQNNAPGTLDLSSESAGTLASYGINEEGTDAFGRQCLMARRMCEAGVRYIQVSYSDNSNNPAWDQHSNIEKHATHAQRTDKPVAGLLADLKQRGLLEDTLVWWGGEFGRTPYAQSNGTGRDHNPDGFTVWLAGAGVKPGFSYGETDDFGHFAIKDKVHMHDLHATVLHLLGLDHEKLTFRHDGRDFRLTDVAGHVVHGILT